jgi:hypothetical protein
MSLRIVTCALAIVAALAGAASPGAAYAARKHFPFIHAGTGGFEPPDPCRARCGGLFAGWLYR